MDVLRAVVDDLIEFAWQLVTGRQSATAGLTPPTSEPAAEAPQPTVARVIDRPIEVHTMTVPTFRAGEPYFVGTPDAVLYLDPVITFDNAQTVLPYGQKVILTELRGRWAAIRYDDIAGWIMKDALVARLVDVTPQLRPGHYYDASDPETRKLRACIHDLFSGRVGGYPLNAAEYVYYRIIADKRCVPWGSMRFRVAGTWQRKLRGQPGVHMGVVPKTGAVMEYVIDDIGYLGYVDAVYPDESIKVTGIGLDDEGIYTERDYTKAAWKELRPIFLRFS